VGRCQVFGDICGFHLQDRNEEDEEGKTSQFPMRLMKQIYPVLMRRLTGKMYRRRGNPRN
jgi:hypothetical protein